MIFDGIYGHEDIKKRLTCALEADKLSHAYIFCGKRGVGKTSMACALANYLTNGSAADIITVTNERYGVKDKASLSVDTVRLARVDVYTKPYLAEKRVFLFPDAHTMTPAAQNALLKVFEEPPAYCMIILLSDSESALLPTIRSRAVTMRFSPLGADVVSRYLADKYGSADPLAVSLASGSIGAAEDYASSVSMLDTVKQMAELFGRFTKTDETAVYDAIAFCEKERQSVGILLDVMSVMLQNALHGKDAEGVPSLGRIHTAAALQILNGIEKTRGAVSTGRNYNMAITELLIEAWRTIHD